MSEVFDIQQQWFDSFGSFAIAGKVYYGLPNTDPTKLINQIDVFSDRALTPGTKLPNPQTIGIGGRVENKPWLNQRYSIEVQDNQGVTIFESQDNGENPGTGEILALSNVIGTDEITAESPAGITEYQDQQVFTLRTVATNTGDMTIDIDGLGPIPLKINGEQIPTGAILADLGIEFSFNSEGNQFDLLSPISSASPRPIGETNPNTIKATKITATGSFVSSQGVAVASDTQPNIWVGDGNTIHITGTDQIDDFTDAPQIGAKVTLIFDAVLILKNGSGITLQGGADITTEIGDTFDVYADAIDAFSGVYHRKSGLLFTAHIKNGNGNFSLTTASGNNAFVVTGLGFKPSHILLMIGNTSPSLSVAFAFMGTQNDSICVFGSGATSTTFRPLSSPVFEAGGSGNSQTLSLQSLDADGFKLSNIKAGSPAGTVNIKWMAFA